MQFHSPYKKKCKCNIESNPKQEEEEEEEKEEKVEMRALPLSSSQSCCCPQFVGVVPQKSSSVAPKRAASSVGVWAKLDEEGSKGEAKKSKQSLFGSLTDALDFSQVRSAEDAQLLEEAREATGSGGRMTKEQYGALRRKIGGTYKDFFKSYIDVDGQYVEEGWVDKTCKVCKKDTRGEARQVDKLGRYVHVACLERSKSGNFFTRLFSR